MGVGVLRALARGRNPAASLRWATWHQLRLLSAVRAMSHLRHRTRGKSTLYVGDSCVFLKSNNNFPPVLLIYITTPAKPIMSQAGEGLGA